MRPASARQLSALRARVERWAMTRWERVFLTTLVGREVVTAEDLTSVEASRVLGLPYHAWADAVCSTAERVAREAS